MHLEPEAPKLSGISVVQRNAPLEVRGGDYYDYVDLGDGRTAFVLGDVMGKKWGAWFFSVAYIAYLRSVIRGTSATLASPAEIIRQVNSLLWDDLKISEVFTTLVFGIIEPARRRITYANAGHLPPITYSAENETATMGTGGGLILGVQPDQNYDEIIIQFAPGDMLVFYTDGITEARNHAGEFFGEDRLASTVQDLAANGSQDVVEGIYAALDEFVEHMPYDDDRTLLVMRADN
jgi:sigma-B regulation protein RsbU (phosphoserine phosphatase)